MTKQEKISRMRKRLGRKGGKATSERKREACRKNAKGGGRPGYPCIVEYRPRVESAWLEVLDDNARPVVYPSKLAAGVAIKELRAALEVHDYNPEREFRVTRV